MRQLTTVEDETGVTKLQNNERGLLTRVEDPAGDVVQKRVLRVTETLVKNIVQLGIDAIGKLLGGGR